MYFRGDCSAPNPTAAIKGKNEVQVDSIFTTCQDGTQFCYTVLDKDVSAWSWDDFYSPNEAQYLACGLKYAETDADGVLELYLEFCSIWSWEYVRTGY